MDYGIMHSGRNNSIHGVGWKYSQSGILDWMGIILPGFSGLLYNKMTRVSTALKGR